jgi:hypothetical protein
MQGNCVKENWMKENWMKGNCKKGNCGGRRRSDPGAAGEQRSVQGAHHFAVIQ